MAEVTIGELKEILGQYPDSTQVRFTAVGYMANGFQVNEGVKITRFGDAGGTWWTSDKKNPKRIISVDRKANVVCLGDGVRLPDNNDGWLYTNRIYTNCPKTEIVLSGFSIREGGR